MELIKNRASGKSFIILDDTGDRYIQLITPEGKVKRLERRLFGTLVKADHTNPKQDEKLTREQIDKYMECLTYAHY